MLPSAPLVASALSLLLAPAAAAPYYGNYSSSPYGNNTYSRRDVSYSNDTGSPYGSHSYGRRDVPYSNYTSLPYSNYTRRAAVRRSIDGMAERAVVAERGYYAGGCTASSFNDFAWTVSDFSYNTSVLFTTPAHQIDSGTVHFTLANPALPYTASCSAYSSQLTDFFYGNIVYNCSAPADSGTTTYFTFNSSPHTLAINQSWVCSDQDSTYPYVFSCFCPSLFSPPFSLSRPLTVSDYFNYVGSVNLTLTCGKSSYQNSNWTIGETFSSDRTECTSPPLTILPSETHVVSKKD